MFAFCVSEQALHGKIEDDGFPSFPGLKNVNEGITSRFLFLHSLFPVVLLSGSAPTLGGYVQMMPIFPLLSRFHMELFLALWFEMLEFFWSRCKYPTAKF